MSRSCSSALPGVQERKADSLEISNIASRKHRAPRKGDGCNLCIELADGPPVIRDDYIALMAAASKHRASVEERPSPGWLFARLVLTFLAEEHGGPPSAQGGDAGLRLSWRCHRI